MLILQHFQKLWLSSFLLVFAIACSKKEYHIENLNNNQIGVIGHGGMGLEHHLQLNSYPSFEKCLSLNTQGIEIDVQMTADGYLVALHGSNLEGSTNCNGTVNDKKLAELEGCNYKWAIGKDYSIVQLKNLFKNIKNPDQHYYSLDCKLYTSDYSEEYMQQFANSISDLVRENNLYENIFVESQDVAFLEELHAFDENLKLFYYAQSIKDALEVNEQLPLKGVTISTDLASKEDIALSHEAGLLVAVFNTQTKKENRDAILKNPDFIQTDKVKYLANLLN